jgi:hypothetical protein
LAREWGGLPGTHQPAQGGGGEDWTAEEAGRILSHTLPMFLLKKFLALASHPA